MKKQKAVKRIPEVRPWAHKIWRELQQKALITRMPKDAIELETLIQEHSEFVVAVALANYVVDGEGVIFHTEAVTHVVECTRKDGRKWLDRAEDTSVITRFPLASFLKVADGFIDQAKEQTADPKFKEKNSYGRYKDPIYAIVLKAMGG